MNSNTHSAPVLAASGVFLNADCLDRWLRDDAYWAQQPYGTRFYFGTGAMDYVQRGILQAALKIVSESMPGARTPVAYVPVHPKLGPLWANTIATTTADHPAHYPLIPLYGDIQKPGERVEAVDETAPKEVLHVR